MCDCDHCANLVPALDWIKKNAPKEVFEAISNLYDKWADAEMELAMESMMKEED